MAASYTPRIPPKLSSDTASFVQRHGLATQLRVALLARLLPLAHDLLVRARCNRLGRRQPLGLLPFYTHLGLLPLYTKLTKLGAFTVLSEKCRTFTQPPP